MSGQHPRALRGGLEGKGSPMESKQKVALTFALHRNGAPVRRETVTRDIVKLGNDPKSHLRVDDELASRMHAVIEVASAEDITLIDLGNEPGTMLNGARVDKGKLRPGDQVQIGGTRIVLERAEGIAVAGVAASGPAPGASAASPFRAGVANPFGTFAAGAPNPFGGSDPIAFESPFAPAVATAPFEVAADAPEGSYTYTLVKSAADVPAEEVEDARTSSVEVMVLWDTTVLHVQHLTPPRSFFVGEEQGKTAPCDYFLPSEKLGAARAPIVLADRGGMVSVVIPKGATGTVEVPGQPKMTVHEAIAQGRTQPCAELAGACQLPLPAGSTAKVDLGGLVFQVSTGNAGRVVAGHFQLDTQGLLYSGISLAVHVGLLAAMAFFMPPMGSTDEDGISQEQQYMLRQSLDAVADKDRAEKEAELAALSTPTDNEGGSGARAKLEEGSMGDTTSHKTGGQYALKGPADNQDVRIARTRALHEAATFGVIELLNSGGGDPNAPTAPWGREDSLGNAALTANGNLWSNAIGESFGAGGLGLSGSGEGGGGPYEGIGGGNVGTIGSGSGTGPGDAFGGGTSHGHLSGKHIAKPPGFRTGVLGVSGRLPPEVIQRIVRQNFGRFRLCYENGMRGNPSLAGRVAVRFVIGRDGAVSNVGNGGSDLPDAAVVSCVVRAFYGLSFPQPDGGIVTVTYPIVFTAGG